MLNARAKHDDISDSQLVLLPAGCEGSIAFDDVHAHRAVAVMHGHVAARRECEQR